MTREWTLRVVAVSCALHAAEEYVTGWQAWASRTLGIDMPTATFVVMNAILVVAAFLLARLGWRRPVAALVIPSATLANGILFHIVPTIAQARPAPGIYTAVLLYLPFSSWALLGAARDGVSRRSIATAAVLGTLMMTGVVLAATRLPSRKPLEPCEIGCLFQRGQEALEEHRYPDYVTHARALAERAPGLPFAAYTLARAYAFNGQPAAALHELGRGADVGLTQDPAGDSAFAGLRETAAFRDVAARIRHNDDPLARGNAAFSLPDSDFIPEALAPDPRGGWLIGSLARRKIVRLAPDGSSADFVVGPGLLRVVGIHADTARALLWFATWAPRPAAPGQAAGSDTRLFKSDLSTGRILREYAPRDPGGSHLFNDLALGTNGDVFITDTDQGWIYRVQSPADSLEVLLRPDPDRFTSANGIALAPDQRTLYVGFLEGIARIDLETRAVTRLPTPPLGSTASVDGLYYHEGFLIAVQHRPGPEQVARFRLSPDGRAIVERQILERGSAILRLPTTGALVGNLFYYIANSHYDRLGEDNRLAAPSGPDQRSTVRVIDLARP